MKKLAQFLIIALSPLLLTGCLGDLIEFSCIFVEDEDHCYQAAAVQNADSDECEKITGEGHTGSNPPKDKCYLMIAENTGRTDVCDHIVGGPGSYTKGQCLEGKNRFREENDLEEEDGEATENFDPVKFRAAREELMLGMDEDVQGEIASIMIDHRNNNPGMSTEEQIEKIQEIAQEQEWLKSLDEQANTLMDQIKGAANDFASQTVDDLYREDIEHFQQAAHDKSLDYLEKNGGKRLREGIENLEYIKGQYDKASEQYEAINEKIESLKKVYDEVNEVYSKVDAINQQVAAGNIEPDKARVLHGAIYLGKGLEYATGYVPVFGSTVSTISKETFDVTIKFATSRAQRTTAINKCIEDPEHCDPNGISPY